MTYEQIETFLTVVTYENISSAADYLFISQSTASSRIQLLEEELGTQLIIRHKGHRKIELTAYGEAFIPIASQWAALWKDTQNLKNSNAVQKLNIASVDAINNFTFLPLFHRLIKEYPRLKLSVSTHHSGEIHGLVESQTADIGYVFSEVRYQNIISKPVYRELMYLVCHKNSAYHDNIHPEELDPENEVFLRWGPDFQRWHDRHWSADRYPVISVNTGSMLQHYLQEPGRWAVAPMSVVQAFREEKELVYYTMQDPPTPRICYQLTNRYPKASHTRAIALFEQELETFIRENQSICTFENWMLMQ